MNMPQTKVKVSSKHQIAVPATVRERLSIAAGDYLIVDVQDGVILLTPAASDPIDDLRGLGHEIWDGLDVEDYIDRLRSE